MLGSGWILQVLREPLHKLGSPTRELRQILNHTEVDGLVVHIHHLGLLLLRQLLGLLHFLRHQGFRWQFHLILYQMELFALLLLHLLLLRQHHGYLVRLALQR